jgi:hypothetical protein
MALTTLDKNTALIGITNTGVESTAQILALLDGSRA